MPDKKVSRDPQWLAVTDVMARLGVSRSTVLREWSNGRLRGRRRSLAPSSPVEIESASLEEYVARLRGGSHE